MLIDPGAILYPPQIVGSRRAGRRLNVSGGPVETPVRYNCRFTLEIVEHRRKRPTSRGEKKFVDVYKGDPTCVRSTTFETVGVRRQLAWVVRPRGDRYDA